MPVYEYRCENGHTFEVLQRMSDDPVATCQVCEASVQRVFHPVAVHFKGSGFYTTDYGRKKGSGTSETGAKKDADSKPDKGSKSDSGGGDKGSTASSDSKSGSAAD